MKIYKITNLINGKQYVGQTIQTLQKRFNGHVSPSVGNSAIYSAIIQYGKDNFKIEELATAQSQKELDELESNFIIELNTVAPNGYNLRTGGQNGGSQYSEESKAKMSLAKTGKSIPQETKDKMSKAHKDRWLDQDLLNNRSIKSKEAWQDPEYRKKLYKSRKDYWSDEDNRKVASEKAKAFTTEEQKRFISEQVKLANQRPEVIEKNRKHKESQQRKVKDSNGVIYNSIKEAADLNHSTSPSIIRVIQGKYKTAGGLKWSYVDEDENN